MINLKEKDELRRAAFDVDKEVWDKMGYADRYNEVVRSVIGFPSKKEWGYMSPILRIEKEDAYLRGVLKESGEGVMALNPGNRAHLLSLEISAVEQAYVNRHQKSVPVIRMREHGGESSFPSA